MNNYKCKNEKCSQEYFFSKTKLKYSNSKKRVEYFNSETGEILTCSKCGEILIPIPSGTFCTTLMMTPEQRQSKLKERSQRHFKREIEEKQKLINNDPKLQS